MPTTLPASGFRDRGAGPGVCAGLGLAGAVMLGLVGSDCGGCWAGGGPAALEQATVSRPTATASSHGLTGAPYCWPLNVSMFSIFHLPPWRTAVTAKSAPA